MKKKSEQLDLNLLRIFMAVCQHQSFTQAAELLGMTQSAVSNAMNRLKAELGESLFTRKGRGIELTVFAKSFSRQLSESMQQIQHVIEAQQSFNPLETKRTFTVYANEYVMLQLYPAVQQLLEATQCSIQFRMTPEVEEQIFDDLSRQQADIAIDLFPSVPPAYEPQELFHEELVAVARQDHPRIRGQISAEQYLQEQHAGLMMRRSNLHIVNVLSRRAIPMRDIQCEFSSLTAMMAMCAESNLLGVAPRRLANECRERFGLQTFEVPFELNSVALKMVWHKAASLNPAHVWLRDIIQAASQRVMTGH